MTALVKLIKAIISWTNSSCKKYYPIPLLTLSGRQLPPQLDLQLASQLQRSPRCQQGRGGVLVRVGCAFPPWGGVPRTYLPQVAPPANAQGHCLAGWLRAETNQQLSRIPEEPSLPTAHPAGADGLPHPSSGWKGGGCCPRNSSPDSTQGNRDSGPPAKLCQDLHAFYGHNLIQLRKVETIQGP